MIKSIGKLTLVTILAALVAGVPLEMSAQTNAASTSTNSATHTKPHGVPDGGKIQAVDKANQTISLGSTPTSTRVYQITPDTTFTKNGKKSSLNDAAIGDDSGIYYIKNADGKRVALSVRLGAKPVKPTAPAPPSIPN